MCECLRNLYWEPIGSFPAIRQRASGIAWLPLLVRVSDQLAPVVRPRCQKDTRGDMGLRYVAAELVVRHVVDAIFDFEASVSQSE
jgi:hypothetical protein